MQSLRSEGAPPGARGFTLLELAVVLALLGAILLAALPRLSIFEDAAFRSDARRLAAVIRQLDDSAASEKSFYRLSFALGTGTLELAKSVDAVTWKAPEDMPQVVHLGRATSVVSVSMNGASKEAGRESVVFEPSGARPFSISLSAGAQKCTISYNPYSGKVKIT